MTSTDEQPIDARLRHVLALHFDGESGSPYWLERQAELGLDVRATVQSEADLPLLGPMDEEALATRPVEDFIPKSLLGRRAEFLVAETAGTLGRPKFAAHRRDEFEAAFVAPFVAAAARVDFPREVNWLFVGPGGPHVIGKAARRCAEALGSPDPFSVDLDPRWAKKLPGGSFAWGRYVRHVEDQALNVLDAQRIGVIFATPVVLASIGPRIDAARRERIGGIHLGGLAVTAEQRTQFETLFPNAVVLSGYGNTLFGMMPELAWAAETGIDYFPHGSRLIVQIVAEDDDGPRLGEPAESGRRGRVVMHRLDETQLIVNLIERDTAVPVAPPADAEAVGFVGDGLRDPRPVVNATRKPALGLY